MRIRSLQLAAALLVSAAACLSLPTHDASNWTRARNAYFEVYAQGGPDRARLTLAWFDQLRQFFDRNRVLQSTTNQEDRSPLTVIGFQSKDEYNQFRLRSTSDAYFASGLDIDYIVLPLLRDSSFPVAAHEYAHSVMHNRGLHLSLWLGEGLAELFSTIQIDHQRCAMGGPLPVKMNLLRRQRWLPASELFRMEADSPARSTQDGAALFYAESWAAADMLVYSQDYAPRLGALIESLNAGLPSASALRSVYGKSAEEVLRDVQAWISRGGSAKQMLPVLPSQPADVQVEELSPFASSMMLGRLLLANGMWQRAEEHFRKLLQQSPASAEALAGLGTAKLYGGDRSAAIAYWRKALDGGVHDSSLCYRYALIAEEAGYPTAEITRALTAAIAERPGFDAARYRLALLQSNDGNYQDAVNQLRAMSKPRPSATFAFWTTLAYALTQLDRRAEAVDAAGHAMQAAGSAAERARASELAYVAQTDLTVRFERASDGQQRLVATRVPHGTLNWNPFVEASDRLQTLEGVLQEVLCSRGQLTGFVVESKSRKISLAVPDPTHVLIRNGPAEFSCGPQSERPVMVEYAVDSAADAGLLRGMDFR